MECTKQDYTDILEVIGDTYKAKNSIYRVKCNNAGIIRNYDVQGTNENQNDHDDYRDAPSFCTVYEFKMAAIS